MTRLFYGASIRADVAFLIGLPRSESAEVANESDTDSGLLG